MNDSSSSDRETLSYSMIDKIDQICDQFERELRNGSVPKIEDYLARVDAPIRERLLRDLVAIDIEFARRNRVVEFAEYFQRFPEAEDALRALQQELEVGEKQQQTTPPVLLSGEQTVLAAAAPKPHLNHFKLVEVAGSGGFGTVWRAMDLRLQREVAVKIPRPDRANQIHMSGLIREARAAAKLRHPNIVSVHEVGEENGLAFIVTDYIHGMNLRDWRRKNSISPHEAARLVAKLAVAVQHAHEKGVIHRDLKLGNVLMDAKGEPHVADFGLAKSEARDDSLAVQGQVLGTPAYMAPEQARADHGAIDRRTDVYALGVMLYELLTGRTPFRGNVEELLQQILDQPPVAPRVLKPEIPWDLDAICLKCLAKSSDKRYDTAKALADDLNLFLNNQTLRGIPAAIPGRVRKWFRRNRRLVTTTTTVALIVALSSTGLMALRSRGNGPSVAQRRVEFITEPPGCEITAVALDPETGDPDPTKIQSANGRTPLTMSLDGGDYLIVAVLNSQRFHEVYRHVPSEKEKDTARLAYNHTSWKTKPDGVIKFGRKIRIPRPDVTFGMGFCEGTNRLIEPKPGNETGTSIWRVAEFYVDLRELTPADLQAANVSEGKTSRAGTGPYASLNHFYCMETAEELGKRLPTAAELYYLSTVVCPQNSILENRDQPCTLPSDKSVVEGLHSGAWEWTSTKPGGPFTGAAPSPELFGSAIALRIAGCGELSISSSETTSTGTTLTGFQLQNQTASMGFRCVRSSKPRRSPQDFTTRSKTVDTQ